MKLKTVDRKRGVGKKEFFIEEHGGAEAPGSGDVRSWGTSLWRVVPRAQAPGTLSFQRSPHQQGKDFQKYLICSKHISVLLTYP